MPFPNCNLCTDVPSNLLSAIPQLLYDAHQCLGFLCICQVFRSKYIHWIDPKRPFPLPGGRGKGEGSDAIHKLSISVLCQSRSRSHERTISLRFLGIILRVLRLEVSVYNVYITDQFSTYFCSRGAGRSKIY